MSNENNERQKIIDIEWITDTHIHKNIYINHDGNIQLYNDKGFKALSDISEEKYIVVQGWTFAFTILDIINKNENVVYTENTGILEVEVSPKYGGDIIYENYEYIRDSYFILENLGNGYYREVMSGITLRGIDNTKNEMNAEQLQNRINELTEIPLVLHLETKQDIKEKFKDSFVGGYKKPKREVEKIISKDFQSENLNDMIFYGGFAYKLDSTFKEYYAREMIPQKDLIIEYMKAFNNLAKNVIKDILDIIKEKAHSDAIVDNFLYDYEKNNPKR